MGKAAWKPGNMLYPVPVVMVSTGDGEGQNNIITVAWAGTVCTNPPMVSVSIRPQRWSYRLIEETGEYVINLVTADLVRAADWCGVKSGREADKFREMGLTPLLPDRLLKAPGILESPVNLECRVEEKLKLGSHDMFLAKIAGIRVSEEYLRPDGKFELNRCGLVAYSHGEYRALGELVGSFGYSVAKKKTNKK